MADAYLWRFDFRSVITTPNTFPFYTYIIEGMLRSQMVVRRSFLYARRAHVLTGIHQNCIFCSKNLQKNEIRYCKMEILHV